MIIRVPTGGGEPVALSTGRHQPNVARVSRDGRSIYYSVVNGPQENHGVWRLSIADGQISRLTKLEGKRGRLGYYFAADAHYLYLTWVENESDIWVMDVAASADRGGVTERIIRK